MQVLITNIILLVCTLNEILVKKIGSGIFSVRLKKEEYTQKIIHVPKTEIKRFEIKNYSTLGLYSGYLLTIEAKKKYYYHIANVTGNDFSPRNFFEMKYQKFLGLFTADKIIE